MSNIKLRIKELRTAKGLSQERLARDIDVGLVWLNSLENKKSKSIAYETLAKICDVLECKPGDLLELEK